MNSRGKRMVNLVKTGEQHQRCKTTPIEKRDDYPDSPVHDNHYTEEEWRLLNDLYDDVFPTSQAEEDTTSESLANDSHNVILGSEEGTPVPSPFPGQDLNVGSPLTEDLVEALNKERVPIQLLPSERDLLIETTSTVTEDSTNLPSISSLISTSNNDCCVIPTSSTSRKRKPTYKTDLGRKRKRHVKEWVDVRRKILTDSGQQYVSKKGKTVPAKTIKPRCPQTCKLQCTKYFTEDIRKNIFDEFWRLSDHTKQWEYINKFTNKFDKNRMTTENPSRRKFTTKYYLPLPANDSTYETQQVCLRMFCGTLAITDQTIRTAHSKLDACGITSGDNRGKHVNHPKKVDDNMIRSVCDHVNSFQPIESHYTRKNTSKRYLDNSLSLSKMFSMYKDWSELFKYNNKAETERQYRNIVNDHMNIAFFIPKKDLCDKCHAFSNEVSPTEGQVFAQNKHISNKETARKYKARDKEEAIQSSSKILCATFDFQKLLNCPSGEVSLFYYKRKLSLMHFTVFGE